MLHRYFTLVGLLLATGLTWVQESQTPDPSQLVARRADHVRARQRATTPVLSGYLRSLEGLKQQLGRESKLEAVRAVEEEIRGVTEQIQAASNAGARPR